MEIFKMYDNFECFSASAVTILDDDKELKSFKQIINSIEYIKIKIIPIIISKPIYEYMDEEIEILDLKTESDAIQEKSVNTIEKNKVDSNENGKLTYLFLNTYEQ